MDLTAVKNAFICIALTAVSYLCVTTALAVRNIEKHVADMTMHAGDTIDQANKTLAQVNITLTKVNAPGGLLQTTGKAVADAKNLIGHADILVAQEQSSISKWDGAITSTLKNVNTAVVTTTANENALTQQTADELTAIKVATQSAQSELTTLNTTTSDLDQVVKNADTLLPDLQATARNVAGITTNLNDTTAEVKKGVYDYFHPTWAQKIWGTTLDVAGHVLNPW